jgi:hypothetical protein
MIHDKLDTLKGLRKVEVISAYDLLNRPGPDAPSPSR